MDDSPTGGDWTLTLPNDEDGVAAAIHNYVLAGG